MADCDGRPHSDPNGQTFLDMLLVEPEPDLIDSILGDRYRDVGVLDAIGPRKGLNPPLHSLTDHLFLPVNADAGRAKKKVFHEQDAPRKSKP